MDSFSTYLDAVNAGMAETARRDCDTLLGLAAAGDQPMRMTTLRALARLIGPGFDDGRVDRAVAHALRAGWLHVAGADADPTVELTEQGRRRAAAIARELA